MLRLGKRNKFEMKFNRNSSYIEDKQYLNNELNFIKQGKVEFITAEELNNSIDRIISNEDKLIPVL